MELQELIDNKTPFLIYHENVYLRYTNILAGTEFYIYFDASNIDIRKRKFYEKTPYPKVLGQKMSENEIEFFYQNKNLFYVAQNNYYGIIYEYSHNPLKNGNNNKRTL